MTLVRITASAVLLTVVHACAPRASDPRVESARPACDPPFEPSWMRDPSAVVSLEEPPACDGVTFTRRGGGDPPRPGLLLAIDGEMRILDAEDALAVRDADGVTYVAAHSRPIRVDLHPAGGDRAIPLGGPPRGAFQWGLGGLVAMPDGWWIDIWATWQTDHYWARRPWREMIFVSRATLRAERLGWADFQAELEPLQRIDFEPVVGGMDVYLERRPGRRLRFRRRPQCDPHSLPQLVDVPARCTTVAPGSRCFGACRG